MKSVSKRLGLGLGLGLVIGLSLSGCISVSDAGYYWGNYSYTYLEAVRNPSEEAIAKHVAELRGILSKSDEKGLKPAPGVCAELAFWLTKADSTNVEEARALYAREIEIYPEARTFIERLLSK